MGEPAPDQQHIAWLGVNDNKLLLGFVILVQIME
jgi:hypothetical protein